MSENNTYVSVEDFENYKHSIEEQLTLMKLSNERYISKFVISVTNKFEEYKTSLNAFNESYNNIIDELNRIQKDINRFEKDMTSSVNLNEIQESLNEINQLLMSNKISTSIPSLILKFGREISLMTEGSNIQSPDVIAEYLKNKYGLICSKTYLSALIEGITDLPETPLNLNAKLILDILNLLPEPENKIPSKSTFPLEKLAKKSKKIKQDSEIELTNENSLSFINSDVIINEYKHQSLDELNTDSNNSNKENINVDTE